jgi:hypothetical protein
LHNRRKLAGRQVENAKIGRFCASWQILTYDEAVGFLTLLGGRIMPFASYASIGDVARIHRVQCKRIELNPPTPVILSGEFQSELSLTLQETPFDASENAVRESLIYPLLRETWKPFQETLTFWIHPPIVYDEDLCGTPDYVVAGISPLGRMIFDPPCYLVVVQARKDDFERGWGECLAALLAIQKLNHLTVESVFGIVTNGTAWEFGILDKTVFRQDRRPFVLSGLDRLAGALHSILEKCCEQAAPQPHIVSRNAGRENRR